MQGRVGKICEAIGRNDTVIIEFDHIIWYTRQSTARLYFKGSGSRVRFYSPGEQNRLMQPSRITDLESDRNAR